MNSDYILKGRGQLALHQPEWAKSAPSGVSASSATSAATPSFEAAVQSHEAAYEAAKKTAGVSKSTSRYAKAEAITEQLNRTSSPSTRTVVADDGDEQGAQQTASSGPTEIGEDGSLYPNRAKSQMNAFTHSGTTKKSVGPGVDTVDYTMEDFLDTINPLQQIPIVNMIYRHLTGDRISGVAQVMGSALYFGATGIISGAVDAIFEQEKGGDMGETIMAGLLGTETPNAHNLPSNKQKRQAQETMLADASNIQNSAAVQAAKVASTKQPFGGVMGNEQPRPANIADANVTNGAIANDDDAVSPDVDVADAEGDAVDAESARIIAAATLATQAPAPVAVQIPVQQKPIEVDGQKMYSLAGVIRHPSVPSHMPLRDAPDVRLKTYGKEIAKSVPAGNMPFGNLKDGGGLLGLQRPTASVAAAPIANDMDIPATILPDPGFSAPMQMPAANGNVQTPSGNQIPAQLIQDMMLMNMQKYQDGLKSGTRGSSLDING